jgi:hypothetical protein
MARAVTIPVRVAEEIAESAAKAERSVGFLVLGALRAAGSLTGEPEGERRQLVLSTDEDDPRDLPSRLGKLAAAKARGRSLDDAVALAWMAGRTQIIAWVERAASVNVGERADDLDRGLRDAADKTTSPTRLAELAKSPYPRVRALVAEHAATPAETLQLLAADRERVVREAVERR